jgi:mRNA interferase RelE/StbE
LSFAPDFGASFEAELMKTGKVKALSGEWAGYYRLRLRSYRAIDKQYGERLVIFLMRAVQNYA